MNAPFEASSVREAEATIDGIKMRVINTIVRADPGVRIKKTDYFNHAFVPDLLLSWPSERVDRQLYLKTSSAPENLREDLADMDEASSIVMPLVEQAISLDSEAGEVSVAPLDTDSSRSSALVATPSAFEALSESRSGGRAIAGFASRALLQGGVGVVVPDRARLFGQSIEAGFAAAQVGQVEETEVALADAESILDPARQRQVNEFLGAVWVGSGATSDSFPGDIEATTSLTAASLGLLLETVDIDDPEFWYRVGRGISMDDLAGLNIPSTHANFQRLIRAIGSTLKVHALRVLDPQAASYIAPGWFAGGGSVGLKSGPALLRLTGGRVEEIEQGGVDATAPISQLARRAQDADIAVATIAIESHARRVNYEAADGTSVTSDAELQTVAGALGRDAVVTNATVNAGGKEIHIDFSTSTAYGLRRANFYLSHLVMNSVPLLVNLTPSERATLSEAVGAEESNEGTTAVSD